jgi:hypothetical protein
MINVDYTVTYFLPELLPRTRARSELLNVSPLPVSSFIQLYLYQRY